MPTLVLSHRYSPDSNALFAAAAWARTASVAAGAAENPSEEPLTARADPYALGSVSVEHRATNTFVYFNNSIEYVPIIEGAAKTRPLTSPPLNGAR